MLLPAELSFLAASIVQRLPRTAPPVDAPRILNGYQQAFPDAELTDESENGIQVGHPIAFWHEGVSVRQGWLLFIKQSRRRDPRGQEEVYEREGVILLPSGKHVRVPWSRISPHTADREASHGDSASS